MDNFSRTIISLLILTSTALRICSATEPQVLDIEGQIGYTTSLADGRLFTVTSSARGIERWADTLVPQPVVGRTSHDDGLTWSDPRVLFEAPGPGTMHTPVALGDRSGRVHIFYLQKLHLVRPPDWAKVAATLWHSVSMDHGESWEEPTGIDFGERYIGALVSVAQLHSGRILLPFSYINLDNETGIFDSTAIYSDDYGNTWKRSRNSVRIDTGGMLVESGAIEPVVTQLSDGRVWMVLRTQAGYLMEAFSEDGGATWTEARRTSFKASNAPAAVLTLKSGATVLTWNNEFGPLLFRGVSYSRQALVMAINHGSGWRGYRQVSPPFHEGDFARANAGYPFLVETRDGSVLVGFNELRTEGKRTVRLVRVPPAWVVESETRETFSNGSENLYTFGTAGGEVTEGPEGAPAFRLQKIDQDQQSGFTWNFPFGRQGTLKLRLYLEPDCGDIAFALSDHALRPSYAEGGVFRWMIDSRQRWNVQYVNNGSYLLGVAQSSPMTLGDIDEEVAVGRPVDVQIDWDLNSNMAKLYRDGQFVAAMVGLGGADGLNFLRVVSTSPRPTAGALWILSMDVRSML